MVCTEKDRYYLKQLFGAFHNEWFDLEQARYVLKCKTRNRIVGFNTLQFLIRGLWGKGLLERKPCRLRHSPHFVWSVKSCNNLWLEEIT